MMSSDSHQAILRLSSMPVTLYTVLADGTSYLVSPHTNDDQQPPTGFMGSGSECVTGKEQDNSYINSASHDHLDIGIESSSQNTCIGADVTNNVKV